MRIVVAFALVVVAGCTKDNPAAKCTDNGTCSDPEFPFCDVNGSISGHPGTCIAPQCIPGKFGSCMDANTALVCDDTGGNYMPVSCGFGCDSQTGCISCEAGCELGCASDGMHCKQVVPSNNLGMYYDAASPQDIALQSGVLNLADSTYFDGTNTVTLPSFDVAAPAGGAPIRVFVGKNITLGSVTITDASQAGVGRAAAFLATNDLQVTGRLVLQTGGVDIAGCSGTRGQRTFPNASTMYNSGSGGGGHASAGAAGGSVAQVAGGAGGAAAAPPELVPLRGGCKGGAASTYAGGAVQLVSRTQIHLAGTIDADGRSGGAGGGILIEAQAVSFSAGAKLLARGGGGAAGNAAPLDPPDDTSPPPGGVCSPPGSACSNGGAGASGTTAALPGQPLTGGLAGNYFAGEGGGGAGFVRINTKDGTAPTAQAVIAASLSVGTVSSM